ncbi:MAG: protein translocase subunit SecF [Dehalococcoidia bacterium]
MLDFAGKRWWYLTVSFVIFLIAAVSLAVFQLRPGIEFTSGSTFTIEFTEKTVSQGELRTAMSELGHPEARVQGAGSNKYLIRTEELQNAPTLDSAQGPDQPGEINTIEDGLRSRFGALNRTNFSTVSETVSTEIARNATLAVIFASIAILIYIWLAFRSLNRPFRYGAAAIIAVLHDAFIILGLFALLGEIHGTEVDLAFITAILTVIGFSVHDTIVVFDRIRETLHNDPYIPFEEAVNASMTETLARSINTSLVVVLTVVSMLLIGGETIRYFLLVLLVGIIAGTYSSICVASQLLVAWENGDFGKFFRKIRGKADEVAAAEPA